MLRRRWHPALVHFPIACWVLATLIDLSLFLPWGVELETVAWSGVAAVLLWTGVLFAIPTMLAGFLDFASLPRAVQDSRELTSHILWMGVAFICFLAAAILRARSSSLETPAVWYVVAVESVGSILLVYGGHLASIVVFERLRTAPLDSEAAQSPPESLKAEPTPRQSLRQ
jgi:uncharacterized membrane protein